MVNLIPCGGHGKGLFFCHSRAIMSVISLVPTLASLDALGPLFQHTPLLRCKLGKVCLWCRTCTEGRAPCW